MCTQDIPRDERKRQYAALRRAILKNANPALTAKFSLCDDGERLALGKNPASSDSASSDSASIAVAATVLPGLGCSRASWSTRAWHPSRWKKGMSGLSGSSAQTNMSRPGS